MGGGGPRVFGVVDADVGDHRYLGIADVRRVPPSEQADLDDSDIDGNVGEPAVRGAGDGLEVAGADTRDQFEVCHRGHLLGEVVVADRLTVAADPLVEPLEVGAGVGTDAEPLGHQQPGDHLGGGALAVGAGDMDDRVGELGVAHRVDQAAHAVEGGRRDAAGDVVVRVLVEVRERVGVRHCVV